LYLHKNKLQSLPDSIGNLHALQELSLSYNNLQSLPESIGNLSSLQYLDLFNNNLQSLPESILSLTKLNTLSLRKNPLSPSTLSITPSQFSFLRSRRTFLKCYFALALNCSFPVVESILINNQN
jgi:Leucine-rich repeat (LRR) protein